MALVDCPDCGKRISDNARACPHCDYALRSASPSEQSFDVLKRALQYLFMLLLLGVAIFTGWMGWVFFILYLIGMCIDAVRRENRAAKKDVKPPVRNPEGPPSEDIWE